MEVVVLVSQPHIITHKIENVICHRAITLKEVDFLCQRLNPQCVLVEYTGVQDITWLQNYAYPVIVITKEPLPKEQVALQLSPDNCHFEEIEQLLNPKQSVVVDESTQTKLQELEEENNCLKENIKYIQTQHESESVTLIKLHEEQVEVLNDTTQALTQENSTLKEVNLELETQVSTLQDTQTSLLEEKTTLSDRVQCLEQEIATLHSEINEQLASYQNLLNAFNLTCDQFTSLQIEMKAYQEKESTWVLQNETLLAEKEVLQQKLSELQTQIASIEETNKQESYQEVDETKRINEITYNFETRIKALESELSLKGLECQDLKEDLDRVSSMLDTTTISLQEARNNAQDVEILKLRITTLEDIERKLNDKLSDTIRDKQIISNSLATKLEIIEQLNRQINTLQTSLSIVSTSGGRLNQVEPKNMVQNYTGRARIINCFGTGSYGTTTLVFSLADVLRNHKVLVIDMDVVNPSLDSWFQQNPTCPHLDATEDAYKTGVCALFERGASYVAANLDKILKPITKNLFYFSGIYVPFARDNIYSTDFTGFLNTIGNQFDYILFDCGRLGSSTETDSIIKSLGHIAHKNVVVALNDVFNIRNASIRMNTMQILTKNPLWVLNISNTTKLDASVAQFTRGARTVVIPKDMSLYGLKRSLNSVPLLKGKIVEVQKLIK